MTLIDDTCDGCGSRFDPMGDPLLTRHLEIGPYAVYCATCEARSTVAELDPALVEKAADALMRTLDTMPAHTYGRHAAEFEVRAVLDAVMPAIREAALLEAAEETHRESRYIAEMTMRGQRPDPLDRVTVLEHALRYLAAQQRKEPTDGR